MLNYCMFKVKIGEAYTIFYIFFFFARRMSESTHIEALKLKHFTLLNSQNSTLTVHSQSSINGLVIETTEYHMRVNSTVSH